MSTHFVATPRTDTREPAAPLPGAPAAIGSSTAVLLPAARTSRARASFTLPEAALSAPDATAASPSDDEITSLEIPTGQPIVYELDDDLNALDRYYLSER